MEKIKKYWKIGVIAIVIIANGFVWYAVYREAPNSYVTVAFLNIGQGDAIFIESPTHTQIIVDGGPPHAILGELAKVMPFYDRSLDALIITNPDTDHFAGFIDVLDHYKVQHVVEAGTHSESKTYALFQKLLQEKNLVSVIGKRGMIIDLGGGAKLHVLYPDKDVSQEKTNDGSLIARLEYGNTSVMLTGDSPKEMEEYLTSLSPQDLKSTVLKVGHHGSKTSSSENFVKAVNPHYAVISAGVKNRYGHPHPDTLKVFDTFNIPVLGTYEKGTIIMKLDGTNIHTSYK